MNARGPAVRRHPLILRGPLPVWEHGLPLGDGLNGAMIWGDGQPLVLSISRADLWDLSAPPEYEAEDYRWDQVVSDHRAGRHDALIARLETPYRRPAPTRLPAGRLKIEGLGPIRRWTLDRERQIASLVGADGRAEAFQEAGANLGRLWADRPLRVVLEAPPFGAAPPTTAAAPVFDGAVGEVWQLGYPPPERLERAGATAYRQAAPNGGDFLVAAAWREAAEGWRAVWRVERAAGVGPQALEHALSALERELDRDHADARRRHARAWRAWWRGRDLALPDPTLEALYVSGLALFGAATAGDGPPAALQGPWTSDTGRLPPWKGDYHHDLNTQMTYWPAASGDHQEADRRFIEWLWETKPACEAWTRRFFGVPGLNVPGSADLLNRQIGGWRQYAHALSTGAWLGMHVHRHWRFWPDDAFLRTRAHPYMRSVATFIAEITCERDEAGRRRAALSCSPEIFDNRPEAWLDTPSAYDLCLFHAALAAAAETALAVGDPSEARRWREVKAELPPLPTDADGAIEIAAGVPYPPEHRHFSHALAIHPLGLLDPDAPEDRRTIAATLDKIPAAGGALWMGYSHAWHAALLARGGRGEAAAEALTRFGEGFVFPNGLHANGDWRGLGLSEAVFGAFTLEGNCAVVEAVHDMLLRGRAGRLRLFPAVPRAWPSARFERLRAEGGLVVKAAMADQQIVEAEILAEAPARVAIAAFGGAYALERALRRGERWRLSAQDLARLGSAV